MLLFFLARDRSGREKNQLYHLIPIYMARGRLFEQK